ncbi:hypothetical protein H4R20_000221 [Coemansia guatemalensis]|uniref:Protein arginine methyltransferase NDUFAF7 n=1 Tax=Coemansia guatemalensis TaxID=2761395 RepID=A0A9W8LX55_9FUNG|nr:hypothetical protein H4R20_000221 [Coemansia guatemalensis]
MLLRTVRSYASTRGIGAVYKIRHENIDAVRRYSLKVSDLGKSLASSKEEPTPLGRHIRDMILATGPMSIAKYMQLALTSPIGGYYTKGQVLGRKGDFVTSPEISQMFGEIVAVWFVLHWEMMGRPSKTAFVELGPGHGTLMDDILRASRRFPGFFASIKNVHLVERSPELRRMQHNKLGCDSQLTKMAEDCDSTDTPAQSTSMTRGGLTVNWYDMVEQIDSSSDNVPLVVAHEFFDALPIYKFEKGHDGLWHEILIDIADSDRKEVAAGAAAKQQNSKRPLSGSDTNACHFKYVRTRGVTANAAFLSRDKSFGTLFDKGDQVEVSPESARIMTQISKWISDKKGMGLVVDYGQDWTQGDTFRGIKEHKFTRPLSFPGTMDLTADVDFRYLRAAAGDQVKCHGPVEQGTFLHSMGIQARLQQLLQSTSDAKLQKNLVDCYKRLTDPHSMGRIYKVLSVFPNSFQGVPVPFTQPTTEELNKPKVEKIVR